MFLKGQLVFILVIIFSYANINAVSVEKDLTLTKQEMVALGKFKAKVMPMLPKGYMQSDIYLVRWLRATNINVQYAIQMLVENLNWRKQYQIDDISDEDWSDMTEEYDYSVDTYDKEGRPVGILNIGSWNIRRAVLSGKMGRLHRYTFKSLEEVTQRVFLLQQAGQNVTQWKALVNMDGFNVFQSACPLCMSVYTQFLSCYEKHYPGFADAIIIINAPSAFTVVDKAIRPIISLETSNVLKIYGNDKTQWVEYLKKEISREQRRHELGGIRQD